MVLSPNLILPKKASRGLHSSSNNLATRSWANVVRNTNYTKLSIINTSDTNEESQSSFPTDTNKPFVKGTMPDSILFDIIHVDNPTVFYDKFTALCKHREHLWSLEEKLRIDGHRRFAEFVVSPEMATKLCSEGAKLKSFETHFQVFYSLSIDAEILKISLSGLPRQYGRANGGAHELRADMIANLSTFDSVMIAVWSAEYQETSLAEGTLQYARLSAKAGTQSSSSDAVTVYATWANMGSSCRYCHQDTHVIDRCPERYRSTMCYNFNTLGHVARICSRKNSAATDGLAPNKKLQKTPVQVSHSAESANKVAAVPPVDSPSERSHAPAVSVALPILDKTQESILASRSTTGTNSSTLPNSKGLPATAVDPIVSGNSIKKSGIVTRQTHSMTSQQTTADNSSLSGISNSQAKITKALVCKHCFKEGHVRKSSKQCDKHEEYMAQLNESKSSQKQMMETSTDKHNNNNNRTAYSSSSESNSLALPTPLTSTLNRSIPLRIATINCRGLTKIVDPSILSHFIRYLRIHSLDIIALQETHAKSLHLQDLFHSQFQAVDSIWSEHCGLVNLSSSLSFSNSSISICERLISTTVTHSNNAFEPVTVTVIYVPASSSARYPFFSNLVNESSRLLPLCPNRYILLGDFNYSSSTTTTTPRAPVVWRQYVSQFFVDCITDHGSVAQPTFHRGNSRSCIDYIFASCDLSSQRSCGSVTYITPAWSDHFLLTSVFHLTASVPSQGSQIGKGLWRAHPRLAKDSAFCEKLEKKISDTVAKFAPDLDVTLKWQELKSVTQKTAKAHSRKVAFDMAQAEKRLQHRRRHIMSNIRRNPDQSPENLPLLRVVERQLDSFQRYRVETLALRSGIRWRELGELSAGYLKKTIATRTAKQLVPPLVHPSTNVLCPSVEDMLDATTTFYSDLYSPETIDQNAIDELLESLPPELHLIPQSSQE
ncbi:hypothetical protein G6F33_011975 [Rhizopus arrhizus]|nr:hypothetical protein G6F33_011975 [Rhizopus arrhizus]KAG1372518.1 hypothetical protein G6F61_010985 [Rhizopus arrhizus]